MFLQTNESLIRTGLYVHRKYIWYHNLVKMKLGLLTSLRSSQWQRGLRLGVLGLRVRIPPENGYLSLLNVVCCRVEVSTTS
jgi:hypothetical protein